MYYFACTGRGNFSRKFHDDQSVAELGGKVHEGHHGLLVLQGRPSL
jgi:hypothetical protein